MLILADIYESGSVGDIFVGNDSLAVNVGQAAENLVLELQLHGGTEIPGVFQGRKHDHVVVLEAIVDIFTGGIFIFQKLAFGFQYGKIELGCKRRV